MENMVLLSEIASLTEFTDHHTQQIATNLSLDSDSPSRQFDNVNRKKQDGEKNKNSTIFDDPTDLVSYLDEWEEPIKRRDEVVSRFRVVNEKIIYFPSCTNHY
jgi:hypothetical protein